MSQVDERIVDLQFNYKQFDDGVQDTLKSLDNLKKGLDLEGAGKSLDGIGESASKLGFNFSALEVMAITALAKITSAIIDFGVQAGKALILDPITDGFKKYEQQVEAVQTIMNATGKEIDEVTGYLDKLMWFTDETSYKYMDMVRNIGRFTSAGVGLDTATTAMQGISVWAGLSGKGIQGAETAMDALSTSIGKGAVKLQEWRRLEQANMATMEFKQTVLDTAESMGVLTREGEKYIANYVDPISGKIKPMEVSVTDFGTALKAGWFNSEVLLESLGKYGGYSTIVAQASEEMGITAIEAMRRIDAYADGSATALGNLGDLSEDVRNQIDAMGEATLDLGRRAFKASQETKTFSDVIAYIQDALSTGWMKTFDLVLGNFREATDMWSDLAEVLYEVFIVSGEARNEMLGLWKEMGGRDVLLEGIINIGKALLQVINAIGEAWGDIFPPMTAEQLLDITERFRALTERLIMSDETADKVKRTFAGLFAALDLARMALSAIFSVVGQVIGIFLPLGGGILDVSAGLGDFIVALRDATVDGNIFGKGLEVVGTVLDKVKDVVHNAAEGVRTGIAKLRDYFSQFGGIDLGPLKIFGDETKIAFTPFTSLANLFKGAWETIVKVFQWAAPIIGPFAQKIGKSISQFAGAFGEAVRSGDMQSFVNLINSGLLGTVIYGIKKFVDSLKDLSQGGGALKGLTDILDGVRGSLEAWQSKLKAEALLTIAGAIAILVASLWVLSGIDGGSLATSLAGITALFTELAVMMVVISKTMGGINIVKMGAISGQLVAISAAILILSIAMKNIASLEWEEIMKGTSALAVLSVILVKSADSLSKSSPKLITGGIGLIAFSAAILILTKAVENLGKLDISTLAKGLSGLAVLMAEISGFTHLVKPEKLMSTGIAMIAMGTALVIMASAVEKFGGLDLITLAKGLGSMAVVLATFAGFTQIIKPEKLVSTGVALIGVGAGLLIIAQAVKSFGSMDLGSLAAGLIAMAASLAAIAGFSQIVNPTSLLAAGVALIGVGVALLLIAQAVKSFGGLSWEELAIGLIALAGALAVIAVAANAMTGTLAGAAAMVIMAAAIMLLVPSLAMLGAMDLANIGIALLALVGVFAVVGVSGMLLAPLTPVIIGLAAAIALLGVGVLAIGAGLLAFSAGLTALSVAGTAGAAALVIAVTSIINLIPMAVGALGQGLLMFIQVIADGTPIIMQALTAIIMGMIQVLVSLAPQLVNAIFVFLNQMLDTALSYVPKMVDTGLKLLVGILDGIRKNMKDIITVTLAIMAEFLRGLAAGIPGVVSAGVDIIVAFLDAIGKETPRVVDAGFKMIIDFVNGLADAIRNNTPTLVTAFANLASAMIEGLIGGLFAGIKGAVDAVKNLGNSLIEGFKDVLGIHSPSKVFEEFGGDTVDGYTKGVDDNSAKAEDATKKMADAAINKAYETFGVSAGKSKIFEELGTTNAESFIDGLNAQGEAIKESLKKVFGADEETLKSMTGIVDEALKTIEDRITSYTDLATDRFNRISTESEVSVAEMITNLKHNQMAIAEWADNIAKLANRGLNEGLLEELRQAGPKSAGEVKALVAASDAEIQELNKVMDRGGQVATQALVTSVGQAPPLMVEQGKNITDAVAQGLTSTSSVNDAMALLISSAKQTAQQNLNPAEFSQMGKNIPEGLSQGITSNISGAKSAVTTMADEVKKATTTAFGIASPSKVYTEYGDNLVTGLAQGITTNASKPLEAFNTLFTTMAAQAEVSGQKVTASAEKGIKSNSAVFGQTGTKYGTDFSNNLSNTQTAANTSGKTVTNRAEEGLKHNASVYGQTGTKYGTDFSTSLSNTQTAANTAGKNVAIEAEKGIKHNADEFYKAGQAAGAGFVRGLEEYVERAAEMAKRIARAAKRAIDDELDINSPSRVMYQSGVWGGLGFVNGLASMANRASLVGSEVGESAIDGINDAIDKIANIVNQEMDYSPTITPVLDLSNIQNGIESLNQMLSGAVDVSPIANNINRIASQMSGDDTNRPAAQQASEGATYNSFTQNNYSPKPINRLDLYRQTKNLLAQQKGQVEGA